MYLEPSDLPSLYFPNGNGDHVVKPILYFFRKKLQRWRGDTVGGKTKKALASEIADLIKEAGVKGREYKGVLQKVNDIQDSYNKAADLKRQSGEGILDEDEAKTFHDKLFGICKHWDVLDPVFHNRSSSRPIAPNGTFKNAPPFVITSARENTEGGNFDLDHPDLFPFGENAFRTVKTTPKQMR
ncbi:hypothetical protein PR002_g22983 [Phytophthora rubi]|uniref:Uncharacterized protein n=1 Tax=Phytophthora rubi TaxID=129364 RepID=A0A6A3IMW9_9STRA|nr:hypothetical protein PR002_g22983 [Phytophthora rubi]